LPAYSSGMELGAVDEQAMFEIARSLRFLLDL
jgi:hypothetical protein